MTPVVASLPSRFQSAKFLASSLAMQQGPDTAFKADAEARCKVQDACTANARSACSACALCDVCAACALALAAVVVLRLQKDEAAHLHQFILHAALDIVQDVIWTTNAM